ncbi:hypothetical protein D3C81_1481410 [compost metagenome]
MSRSQLTAKVSALAPFLASAHLITSFTSRLASTGCLNSFFNQRLRYLRVLLKEQSHLLSYNSIHRTSRGSATELVLRLTDKLDLSHFDADDSHHALTQIVAFEILLFFFQKSIFTRIVVHNTSISRLEACLMRTATARWNRVNERNQRLRIACIVLQSYLNLNLIPFSIKMYDVVQNVLSVVQEFNELTGSTLIKELI